MIKENDYVILLILLISMIQKLARVENRKHELEVIRDFFPPWTIKKKKKHIIFKDISTIRAMHHYI